jgi:hypothetical protein
MLTSNAPAAVSQKLSAFITGKATSRAPICRGTTKFINPTTNGIAMKKIMIVVRFMSRQTPICGSTVRALTADIGLVPRCMA